MTDELTAHLHAVADEMRERITPTHPAYLVETVLHFEDEAAAADAYRSIREGAGQCDYAISQLGADGPVSVPGWPVDELFTAEMQSTA